MKPRIVDLPKLYFIGLKTELVMSDINTIGPAMWKELMSKFSDLDENDNLICLGVTLTQDNCSENDTLTYMAGYASKEPIERREGLILHEISECKYAVFTHKGSVMNVNDTFSYAYNKWLPQSDYKTLHHEDLEHYDNRFDEGNPDKSEMDIYIPIQ